MFKAIFRLITAVAPTRTDFLTLHSPAKVAARVKLSTSTPSSAARVTWRRSAPAPTTPATPTRANMAFARACPIRDRHKISTAPATRGGPERFATSPIAKSPAKMAALPNMAMDTASASALPVLPVRTVNLIPVITSTAKMAQPR